MTWCVNCLITTRKYCLSPVTVPLVFLHQMRLELAYLCDSQKLKNPWISRDDIIWWISSFRFLYGKYIIPGIKPFYPHQNWTLWSQCTIACNSLHHNNFASFHSNLFIEIFLLCIWLRCSCSTRSSCDFTTGYVWETRIHNQPQRLSWWLHS